MSTDTKITLSKWGLGTRVWGLAEKYISPIPNPQSQIPTKSGNGGQDAQKSGLLLAEPEVKTKRPPLFKVLLLNDDYTPMDFVTFVLKDIFHKNHEEAVAIMLEIHNKGQGLCGIYTRDVAETKAELVITISRRNEYPLQCRVEKE